MGSELAELPLPHFRHGLLAACARLGLPDPGADTTDRLFEHYEELRRWNPTVALVGPGMAGEALEQHYAESLAGIPLLPPTASTLVDVGSGAGFPGLILAAATKLHVTVIESRERKAAFLLAAARRMSLQVSCLNARVESLPPAGLPNQIDAVTIRAVRLTQGRLEPFMTRLSPQGRLILWCSETPQHPDSLELIAEKPLVGNRRIVAFGPTA